MPENPKKLEIPFTGEWQPSQDPLLLDENSFSDIKNMRYTDKSLKGVNGYSKINTAPFYSDIDYTEFVETDVGGNRLSVAANTITVTNLDTDEDVSVHYDKGASFFSGDFEHQLEFKCTASTSGICGLWAVTNNIDGLYGLDSGDLDHLSLRWDNGLTTDSYTRLLLHCDGSDGSTTFTDSSPDPKTVTAYGNAQIDTAQKKFGTASGLFDGTGDYLSTPDNSSWEMGAGNATIDFWVRFNSLTANKYNCIFNQEEDSYNFVRLYVDRFTNQLKFHIRGGGPVMYVDAVELTGNWSPSTGTWYHVAVIRGWGGNANSWALTIDGTSIGTLTDSSAWPNINGSFLIAKCDNKGIDTDYVYLNGWIDEFRVSKGIARWTENFTKPGGAYEQGLVLSETNSAVNTTDSSVGLNLNTNYYLTVKRDESVGTFGTLYAYIYSDSARTVLIDTLAVSLTEKKDFRYIFGMISYDGASGGNVWSGTISNLSGISGALYNSIVSGYHFKKDQPSETHALVQAANNLGQTKVFQNKTSIPDQGNFEETAVYSDPSGALTGRFCSAAQGNVVYCNGVESLIWGGDELRCAAFILATESIGEVADANTTHKDEDCSVITDWTDDDVGDGASTQATFDSQSTFKLDSGSAGAGNYARRTIDVGSFGDRVTVEIKLYHSALGAYGDTDFFHFLATRDDVDFSVIFATDGLYVYDGAAYNLVGAWVSTGVWQIWTFDIDFSTPESATVDIYLNDELKKSGQDCSYTGAFANGQVQVTQRGSTTAHRITYVDYIQVGDGGFFGTSGSIINPKDFTDQIQNTLTTSDEVATIASPYLCGVIGSTRPLQGVKFYVSTPNTATSTLQFAERIQTAWSELTITDGTSVGGKALAQTGTVSWASTASTSRQRYIEGRVLYWYQWTLSIGSATISHITVDAPMQQMRNVWSGDPSVVASCKKYDGSVYYDYTVEVNDPITTTVAVLDSFATTDDLYLGFLTPQQGFEIFIPPGKGNGTTNSLNVKYWDGDSFVSVYGLIDGTSDGSAALARSGVVSFTQPTRGTEFPSTIGQEGPYYYYAIRTVSAAMDSETEIYYITGIEAPQKIPAHKFAVDFQTRVLLCSPTESPEAVLVSAENAPDVYNGEDSTTYYFGGHDDLVAGIGLYNRFGASIYNMAILCKKSETWIFSGYSLDTFEKFCLSKTTGCCAPATIDTCEIGYRITKEIIRNVAVWLSYDGPVICDGGILVPIKGVEPYFDKSDSRCINYDSVSISQGFFDPLRKEYNLLIPSGSGQTTLNVWLIYDLIRNKWTKKVPALYPQCGFRVQDVNGAKYVYLGFSNGYLALNETGTTFDGTAIDQSVTLSDKFLSKSMWDITQLDFLKLMCKAKNTGVSNSVSVFHRVDGSETWEALKSVPMYASGKRYVNNVQRVNKKGLSHEIKLECSTNDKVDGFEPIALGLLYETIRLDK